MTQTKKKTLTFLGITIILLLALVISFAGQGKENIASADSTTPNPTVQKLNGVMANGEVHGVTSNEGTAINDANDLRNFLASGSGKGYLVKDIPDFSWDGKFTRRLMSANVTVLDGNGHTITLTATGLATDNTTAELKSLANTSDKQNPDKDSAYAVDRSLFNDSALNTYAGTKDTRANLDLHAGLIGYLRPNQVIKNCKFVYDKNIDLSYSTSNCGTFGLIVAYSLGTIDNCSLTIGKNITFFADTDWTSSAGGFANYGQETMSRHSFALGGYVGTMSSNAVVSNSKITLKGNISLSVQGQNKGATSLEYWKCYARAWVGGVVGWMANGSKVFNILTEGSGNLDARCVNPKDNRTRSFSGIVAGISAYDLDGGQGSLAGKVETIGTIKGIINNWTGYASYLTQDTQYSPTNVEDNTIQYLIIGAAGQLNYGESNVSDIYMTKEVYSGTTFSIGFDYSATKGVNGDNKGRYYSTNILIQDVLSKTDGSGEFVPASAENAYLTFSGNEEDSPLWVVYDLKSDDKILWSKSVTNRATNKTDLEYYYDQATSFEDAQKFNVTHTEIQRGINENYTIQYTHGKAVYYKLSYSNLLEENPTTGDVTLDFVRYGASLTAPGLKLFYDEACTKSIRTLTDRSYWLSVGNKSNVPVRMSDGIVSPDTYKSYLYMESTDGRNYNYIQFVSTMYRYVSYIYDDPDYKKYAAAHEGYMPVRGGQKQTDWQKRIIQEVRPKQASIDWGHDSDIVENEDSGRIYDKLTGAITSYRQFTTVYDGNPVVFSSDIPKDTLTNGDTCSAICEYRMLDSYTGEYIKVDSCVNAGTYKIVVTGLTNTNYELSMGSTYADYSIDFVIKQRKISLINGYTDEIEDDAYKIELQYAAKDMTLADDMEIFETQQQANASKAKLKLYNVLAKDSNIVKFDYLAIGDEDLNMRNVGKFQMIMSLQSGINSGNYELPEVTKFIIEITKADVEVLSVKPSYSYPYGFFVKDQVDPYVTVVGAGGIPLIFNKITNYQIIDGEPVEMITQQPFNAGAYQIKYEFINEEDSNYNDGSITVDVTIQKRTVGLKYKVNPTNRQLEIAYGKSVFDSEYGFGIEFNRQSSERGIITYEYSSSIPVFTFNKVGTDIWVNDPVDAGSYDIKIDIDFKVGTTTTGWQINENTKDNYNVVYDDYRIDIAKRTVTVSLNKQTKEYGDELPELTGGAWAADSIRAWSYASASSKKEDQFLAEDNIVLLPVLSNLDTRAFAGDYSISIPNDASHRTDKAHLDDPTLDTYNKIDNYIIIIDNNGKSGLYVINPRTVKVKVNLNTNSVIYRDPLPEYLGVTVIGEKDFLEDDGIELVDVWGDIKVGSSVNKQGNPYAVFVEIKEMDNNMHKNYKLEVEPATFDITPKTLTIIDVQLEDGNKYIEYEYNGEVHKPSLVVTFAEGTFSNVDFNYSYFEIVDGVMSTEATENPSYAGTYRAFISDASNENYTVVFGEEYQTRIEIIMTITKRNVSINVLPAYRIYSIADSLTPIIRPASEGGGIHEEEGYHYYTQDQAIEINRERYLAPFEYAADSEDEFVQDYEYLKASMYIDEYYTDLGVKYGVVKILFNGLEPDLDFLDEEGNWITEEAVDSQGNPIQIIVPRYRNYNITITPGDLHVIGANLSNVEQFVNLRSSEEVYNGQDRYEDFRVITSNQTIFNALKFRVFRYVAISSLSKTDADASIKAYGKYTREQVDGVYVYDRNDEEGTYVRRYLRRKENGESVDDKLVDAGQYFKHITPADPNIFEGEYIMPFYIKKAVREVSADDIKVTVNYDRISLTSKIDGMEVSVNGASFVNRNTFVDLKPNTDYVVKVRFAGSTNYLQSDEIVLNLHTGIDISAIKSTLEKYEKIDFSNINEYESKVLAFIDSVSEEDKSRIDQAKYAKLQASYEQLLRGANSVVAGAQKAGATAVGKSGKSSTATKAVALSMSGVGVLMAGFMFFAKRKKEDEQDTQAVKKAKSVGVKRASKVIVMAVAVVLVCLTVFAGCDPAEDDGAFSKADLYKIASYQGDTKTGSRDLTIEVTSSGTTLYKYADGNEEIDPRLDVSSIAFGADGVGFEFDDLYFTNSEFTVDGETATFKADVKETLVFLGVDKATNGKVSVVVNTSTQKLKTIDVTYDVVNAGITYNVAIAVKAK
ncbi:MAG: hypothetical protein K2I23_04550 [Clostridia bacterium]|nr:hypothetical protein [Clostridia bacterium]